MSNARYIEIDSTYRNRNEWPNPAEFEILISQSGRKDKLNADDPVSLATPIGISWSPTGSSSGSPTGFNQYGGSGTIVAKVIGITGANAGDQKKTIQVVNKNNNNLFNNIEGYYNGVVLKNITQSTANTQIASRITSFVYLGQISTDTYRYQITVDEAIKFDTDDEIQINDPTLTTLTDYSYFFIPNGRIGSNAYSGYILYNDTQNSYKKILGYDSITKLVKIDTAPSWLLSDKLSIRKQAPIQIKTSDIDNTTEFSTSVFSIKNTFSDEPNTYKNSYVKRGNETRRIVRYETFSGKATIINSTTIQFPNNASNVNGFYNNAYIQISGQARKIISYNFDPTKLIGTATVSNSLSPLSGSVDFTFHSVFVNPPFDSNITASTPLEILPFSHDNHNPFVYTGSMVSQQEAVCYQVELMDLILPNKILNCGFGSRIAFYPYLYVELTNISGANVGMKNTIYSNNPNATSMIFRVPIYDVQNPIASAFVKLDGDGMVQTVKFKPNESIFFSVHLPNGELFKVLEEENYGPQVPNPDIQISALFSFKRV
jgi:hypothetical protein